MSNPFGGNSTAAKAPKKPAGATDPFAVAGPDGPTASRKSGDPFTTASTGMSTSDFQFRDHIGDLLLVRATEHIESIMTSVNPSEPTDAVRADVVVLNDDGTGVLHEDILVFPINLKRQLKPLTLTGQPLVARLGYGDKKPGKNAPYVFVPNPTEAELDLARTYGTENNWW